MSNMPSSLFSWLGRNAPTVRDRLMEKHKNLLNPQLGYVLSQILMDYITNDGRCRSRPIDTLREVQAGEITGLSIENPNARVFVGEGATFHNCRILGAMPAFIFIGAGTQLLGTTFTGRAEVNIYNIGFGCRIDSMMLHGLSQISLIGIGAGTTTHPGCNFFTQESSYILLGEDCMLSRDIFLRASDSHSIYSLDTHKRLNKAAPILVHPHVWISRNVSINKGSQIGRDTVIGQGSIVSGNLHANSVYAGVPARQLKSGVYWDRGLASQLPDEYDHARSHFNPNFKPIRDGGIAAAPEVVAGIEARVSRALATGNTSFSCIEEPVFDAGACTLLNELSKLLHDIQMAHSQQAQSGKS